MKPWLQASTQLARTQPLVVSPVMTRVSMPQVVSVEASEVPKNALGYCFETTSSSVADIEAGRPRAERAAFDEMAQRLGLLIEAAAVQGVLLIDDVGIDDRNAGGARRVAHADRGRERILDAGVEVAGLLEIGLHEIDQQQRRALAEADAVLVDALIVRLQVGHRAIICPDEF